ncbi:uncharacterized protein BDZ99DRAFT_450582 [Mytilinidion resinicola]|uniref:Nudix hydrolase domain-containing protein n=1 Tax=Mytilinidion resinicola TaxID=574789 RepID=A0A6A6Y936_9PEZI|nr:uncharacterized protein BDZ99DRAFT_450582 [Mytilinidion resinicola]KAF2805068.1 hypothetical protein BDZ99DRAFT_450582 [Mytilinidion resinicola]
MADPHARSQSVTRNFGSEDFVIGAGVAIFHLASQRVVLCSEIHRGRKYYFLPKGRRDMGEDSGRNAVREGFEESGFRNRLLPLPTKHLQPAPHPRPDQLSLTAEAVATEFMPVGRGLQYILFWYIAETLPPDDVEALDREHGPTLFGTPPEYPQYLTLQSRLEMEPKGWVPQRTAGTGVDSDEALYESDLYPLAEALRLLGEGSVQADVVGRGWTAICKRWDDEKPVVEPAQTS